MKKKWNSASIFCGNLGSRLLAYISGTQQYQKHRIDKFLRSLISPQSIDAPTLFAVAIKHSENCFINRSWYKTLSTEQLVNVQDLMKSGALKEAPNPAFASLSRHSPSGLPLDVRFA
jgi:hypothetical protein